jgi:AraC family transcriptional regulator of adaptative response/methylated-DNA-[protein]-cysteine methyltransferase
MYDGAMSDYERIERVIRYLDEHHRLQPGLGELAEIAGVSRFHFHRLFSAWAGVTPKDFLQCLTVEHAKTLLRQGRDVLSASLEAGLSGPGRLHDLCISLEAMSPGELKSGGSGLNIVFGFAATPFGDCLIGECERGVCHLAFIDGDGPDAALEELHDRWTGARLRRSDGTAADLASRIFARPGRHKKRPTLRAFVEGSAFQVRVWRALLRVPPGSLVTYGQLAAAIGQPGAARAVGSAVGQNPLAYLIPCHRVIRETGVIGDYRWGRVRKRAMVGWETSGRIERSPSAVPTWAATSSKS